MKIDNYINTTMLLAYNCHRFPWDNQIVVSLETKPPALGPGPEKSIWYSKTRDHCRASNVLVIARIGRGELFVVVVVSTALARLMRSTS